MASPIFPGVGTQSRIAQVQQAGSDFNLRQEALNRQSGQALLGTALQGTLGLGSLLNQAVQQALDRKQRGTEADAARQAAIAQIVATGGQARETGREVSRLGTEEAKRIEGLTQTELERQEARGEPGGADFIERIRREVVTGGQEKDVADIRARALRETGPLAAETSRQQNLQEELRQRRESAEQEALTAQRISRDPITALEDQLTAMLETVELRVREGQGVRAQAEFEARLPDLLEVYEVLLQADPTAAERAPILETFRTLNAQREAAQQSQIQEQEAGALQEAADRAARMRLRQANPLEQFIPGRIPGVPTDFGGRRGF